MPSISKSVSYLEPRFIEYNDYSTTFNPKLEELSYSKLIYE
jgi:hypothetical protein